LKAPSTAHVLWSALSVTVHTERQRPFQKLDGLNLALLMHAVSVLTPCGASEPYTA
jgi:hypothetical protein